MLILFYSIPLKYFFLNFKHFFKIDDEETLFIISILNAMRVMTCK